MDSTKISVHQFRTRLGSKQYDVTLTKEQSVLTRIIVLFERQNMQTKQYALGYIIYLYFQDYKLTIEIDKKMDKVTEILATK